MAQALLEEAPMLFINAKLIDGNGGEPVEDGAVRVEGNRITQVGRTADWGENPNGSNRVLDLKGKTLMPGLTEGHFHISFWGVRELPDLDLKLPAELSTIYAVKNAELALRCGYTSAASAGALHRVDVTIRDAIEEGIIFGPRLAASGRDICATSGMLDWNPSFWRLGMEGSRSSPTASTRSARPSARTSRRAATSSRCTSPARACSAAAPGIPPEETMYSLEEIKAAVREAHTRNRQIAAHVRGDDGVKLCVEAGIDVIEHATYADDEAIEMIADRRDDIFVVPGLGYHWGILQKGLACGISQEMIDASGYQDEWERGCVRRWQKMREAGVRIIPGGDYGFIWCPHGEYAKDIEIFVTDMGFSPMEAIVAATKHGSAADAAGRTRPARSRRASSPTCSSSTATRSRTSRSSRTARAWRW